MDVITASAAAFRVIPSAALCPADAVPLVVLSVTKRPRQRAPWHFQGDLTWLAAAPMAAWTPTTVAILIDHLADVLPPHDRSRTRVTVRPPVRGREVSIVVSIGRSGVLVLFGGKSVALPEHVREWLMQLARVDALTLTLTPIIRSVRRHA